MDYQIILTRERGKWTAEVPALPGCVTWGSSKTEALALAREAIEGWLVSREAVGKKTPRSQPTVELALVRV
jgi:predicted RNase H-like HicB family nuclease